VISVSFKNNPCKCALHDHEFKNPSNLNNNKGIALDNGQANNVNINNNCPLFEFFCQLNPEYYFYESNKKKFFCFYCAEFCLSLNEQVLENEFIFNIKPSTNVINNTKNISETKNKKNKSLSSLSYMMNSCKFSDIVTKDKLIKIPSLNIKNELPVCSCQALHYHYPFYENMNCLGIALHADDIIDSININKLPVIILDDVNYQKFFDPVFKVVTSIFDNNDSDVNYNTESINLYESKVFKSSIELLESVSERFTKSYNPILNYNNNFSIFKFFTFDFMIKVFENTDRTPHITYLKADLLKFFDINIYSYSIKENCKKINPNNRKRLDCENADLEFDFDYRINIFIDRISSYIGNIKTTGYAFKSLLRSWEKFYTKIIILKNDYIFFRKVFLKDHNTNMKYSFQECKFNEDIFKLLFSLSTQTCDNLTNINNKKFYDLILNKDDYYSNKIKIFYESNFNLFSKEILSIIENKYTHKDIKNNDDYIKKFMDFTSNSLNEEKINIVENSIKEIELILNEYYANKTNDRDFLHKCKTVLENLENYVKKNILNFGLFDKNIKSNNNSTEKLKIIFFKNQICLFKLNLFNELIYLWICLIKNVYVKTKKDLLMIRDSVLVFILRILDHLTFENPFLSELFFNKFLVEVFLDFKDFYIKRLKTLKKYNYKVNLEDYTRAVVTNFKLNKWYEDSNDSCSVIRIYFYILKFCSNKTKMICNRLIYDELLSVINSKHYPDALNKIMEFFIEKSKVVRDSRGNDYSILSNVIYSNFFILIKYLMKSIYYLKSVFFYLLNNNLNCVTISKIISIDYSLDPTFRKAFTDIYYRHYCESYFIVKPALGQNDLQELKVKIDFNLHTKVDYNNKRNLISNISNTANNIENDLHPKVRLKPLIYNIEIFKLMIVFHDIKFKNKVKKIIKYFDHFIIRPVIYSIYKIIYFAENISAELKYLIYKLIFLFLESYKYFLDLIRNNDLSNPNMHNFILLDEILYLPYENISEITDFIKQTYFRLDLDVAKINSDGFEQLNLNQLMNIYFSYMENFNFYRNLIKHNEDNDEGNSIEDEIIFKRKQNDIYSINLNNKYEASLNKVNNNSLGLNNNHIINSTNNLKENLIESSKENQIYSMNSKIRKNLNNLENVTLSNDCYLSFKKDIQSFVLEYELRKNDFFRDNILKKIFSEEVNEDLNSPNYKQTIALDLFSKIDFNFTNNLNPINEENGCIFESINKVFKSAPHLWQDIILDRINDSKNLITSIIEKQFPFLFQCILIEFNRLDTKKDSVYHQMFLNLFEFFRLLCENHNKIFQTLLINFKINEVNDDYYHFNFILKIPIIIFEYLKYYNEKKEMLRFFGENDSFYFEDILNKLTEYYIELIQGCLSRNFNLISSMKEFSEYYESHYRFFDLLEGNKVYEIILSNFIKFINCFIEENSNELENKIDLIKKLNPKKLYVVLISCFTELFKYIEDIKEPKNVFSIRNYEKCLKERFLSSFLINKYDMFDLPYFNISFGIYKYFKRVSSYKGHGEKVIKVLDNFKKTNIVVFELFNFIIKDVEIVFKLENSIDQEYLMKFKDFFEKPSMTGLFKELENSQDKDKNLLDKVIFLIHKNSIFLYEEDIFFFLKVAPYDDFNNKLHFLLEYFPVMNQNIEVRKILKDKNNLILNYLYGINYNRLEVISSILSFLCCTILMFTLRYDDKMILEFSGKNYVYGLAIFHNIFLLFLLVNWLSFNIYKKWISRTPEITTFEFIKGSLTLLFDESIFILLWNFTFGVISLSSEKLNFLFALQLFSIFKIVPTMFSVIYAVKIRYKQFASTGFLLMILILFYTSITYFFFRDDLYRSDVGENICETYFQCFLFLLNYGIRSGSGIEFGIKQINEVGFYKEFIFGWIFYFIIMLIIVNIINGIIVDTFQALREQNNKKDDILQNFCYICSLDRAQFEIKGVNFEKHVSIDHKIQNYFDYLIKIQGTDEQDLNSLDSQVLHAIREFKTDFFPNKKAKSLDSVKI